ncbi:hypothetical protein [Aliivibrio sifiae]|uniref:hypothetical protein n=1 Tax=Aliivibrio sifiae TaxID=566293 RepID=UPI0021570952|nr:hypothetical protein [Aliivibrio sifiae]
MDQMKVNYLIGYFSDSWSHMDEGYPEALDNAENNGSQIRSIWKQAPVQFETCDDMTKWKTEHDFSKKEVIEVFNYALDHHALLIDAKSKPIPNQGERMSRIFVNETS